MSKRKIIIIILINFIGLFLFTYIGPNSAKLNKDLKNKEEPVIKEDDDKTDNKE